MSEAIIWSLGTTCLTILLCILFLGFSIFGSTLRNAGFEHHFVQAGILTVICTHYVVHTSIPFFTPCHSFLFSF